MNPPFQFGRAISDEFFTDRTQESARLLANFQNGINTILISPRRWGKTSLVKRVAKTAATEEVKIIYKITPPTYNNSLGSYGCIPQQRLLQQASKMQ